MSAAFDDTNLVAYAGPAPMMRLAEWVGLAQLVADMRAFTHDHAPQLHALHREFLATLFAVGVSLLALPGAASALTLRERIRSN